MIWGTETAACISSRGTYLFPVTSSNNAVYSTSGGADNTHIWVSAYELDNPGWGGTSPDTVFQAQDAAPYVAGEFVWTGFDYIGEPTPYDGNPGARSSYFGIVDLAGFKKDRFYLYQARWRPDLAMCHILPHWTWPERVGQVTPVHVFSSADEVELFVNGVSQGRQTRPGSPSTASAGTTSSTPPATCAPWPTRAATSGPWTRARRPATPPRSTSPWTVAPSPATGSTWPT